jgi:hypothetical protein
MRKLAQMGLVLGTVLYTCGASFTRHEIYGHETLTMLIYINPYLYLSPGGKVIRIVPNSMGWVLLPRLCYTLMTFLVSCFLQVMKYDPPLIS